MYYFILKYLYYNNKFNTVCNMLYLSNVKAGHLLNYFGVFYCMDVKTGLSWKWQRSSSGCWKVYLREDEPKTSWFQRKTNQKMLHQVSESRNFIKALKRRVKFIGQLHNEFLTSFIEDEAHIKRGRRRPISPVLRISNIKNRSVSTVIWMEQLRIERSGCDYNAFL